MQPNHVFFKGLSTKYIGKTKLTQFGRSNISNKCLNYIHFYSTPRYIHPLFVGCGNFILASQIIYNFTIVEGCNFEWSEEFFWYTNLLIIIWFYVNAHYGGVNNVVALYYFLGMPIFKLQ
jgi:hypothetical protein